jgi:hypothetical protein
MAGFPATDQATCSSYVAANNSDECYALYSQYEEANACSGTAPPPPGGDASSSSCKTLSPCCTSPAVEAFSQSAVRACQATAAGGIENACAASLALYCGNVDAGCTSGACDASRQDANGPEVGLPDVARPVDVTIPVDAAPPVDSTVPVDVTPPVDSSPVDSTPPPDSTPNEASADVLTDGYDPFDGDAAFDSDDLADGGGDAVTDLDGSGPFDSAAPEAGLHGDAVSFPSRPGRLPWW